MGEWLNLFDDLSLAWQNTLGITTEETIARAPLVNWAAQDLIHLKPNPDSSIDSSEGVDHNFLLISSLELVPSTFETEIS